MVSQYFASNLQTVDLPLFLRVDEETLMLEWFGVNVRNIKVKLCFHCALRLHESHNLHEITFYGRKELHNNALTLMRTIRKRDNWCCECGCFPLFWIDTEQHRNSVGLIVAFARCSAWHPPILASIYTSY